MECEHRSLIEELADVEEVHEVAATSGEVATLQERMRVIVGKALKARDILYPCRFCQHLWK